MYGVFTAYEKQLWHDWIAAGWQSRVRRLLPGSWQLPASPEGDAVNVDAHDIEALIERMAGNRHATPDGLQATRAYLQATGMIQEQAR